MDRRRTLACFVIAAAAAILGFHLFLPPIVGLADQGDFARIIGRFGYAPEDKSATIAFVTRKYVPGSASRLPEWEQPSSEYLFVGAAILLNKLFSHDGKLDIVMIGAVHALAFLAAFTRLLMVTKQYRGAPLFWIVGLIALTDVGYAAYWNSFYAEPASCIFFLLLAAESFAISNSKHISTRRITLWFLWAILWILAKAQNAPLGIVLTLFSARLWTQRLAILGSVLLAAATLVNILTIPKRVQWADAYNQMFLAILPESKHPADDLIGLGLKPDLVKYSGTGAGVQARDITKWWRVDSSETASRPSRLSDSTSRIQLESGGTRSVCSQSHFRSARNGAETSSEQPDARREREAPRSPYGATSTNEFCDESASCFSYFFVFHRSSLWRPGCIFPNTAVKSNCLPC